MYIEVKAKQDKAEKQLKSLERKVDAGSKKMQKDVGRLGSSFSNLAGKIKVIGGVIAGAFVVKKVFDLGRAAINTAMNFEMLRSRLVALKGSQEEANKTFEIYKKLAATTPFDLQSLTEAGAAMEAFGIDSQKHLKTTADLAAFMGVTAQEAASAWGRAWAGGAGAADIFRERGVLNLIKMKTGIEDLTKLTKEEFQQTMVKVFTDVNGRIAGATDILAKTAKGGISNFQDALDALADATFKRTLPAINRLARAGASLIEKITPVETNLEKVTKASAEQRIEFEQLVAKYTILSRKQNKSKTEHKEYQNTINQLNSNYGEYLGNINLEKDSYDAVKKAIDGARDALIEKTRVQAIEAEFADKQAEVVALQRQQIQAVNATANSMAKLKIAGIDVKNITDEQLENIIRIGTIQGNFKTSYTETAKAALSIIRNRTLEQTLMEQIAEKQNELLNFTERYNTELETAGEASMQNATNLNNAAISASSLKDSFVAINEESTIITEGTKNVAKTFNDVLEKQKLGITAQKRSKKFLEGIKNTQVEMVPAISEITAKNKLSAAQYERNNMLLRDAADLISKNVAGGITDALLGAKSLGEALKGIGKQLVAMATNKILSFGIDFLLTGGTSAIGGGLFGGLRKVFGFAQGGEISNISGRPILKGAEGLNFVVPPGFQNDSFPIAVQSGEHVKVTPAGQSASNENYNISLNIRALDPIGFERWAKTDGRSAINNLLRDLQDRGRN